MKVGVEMNEKQNKKYEEPTGRAVGIFRSHAEAEAARAALIDEGRDPKDVYILYGDVDAARLDESAKWFADTDETMKRLKRNLENGHTLISAGAENDEALDAIRNIYTRTGAWKMTHFGTWMTQSEDLES